MGIKGAMTILKKECLFLGLSMKELLLFIELNPYAFSNKSVRAATIYKKENA
tara:strand:+ start:377 stop:532 length:156 start_codon:yes stop_codon:yes gene_type:complete